MTAILRRGLLFTYHAFSSRPSTLVAQFLILAILGAMTITGMNYVARQENRTISTDWMGSR